MSKNKVKFSLYFMNIQLGYLNLFILLLIVASQIIVLIYLFLSNKNLTNEFKQYINSSVQTKFLEFKADAKDLIDLASEVWKLEQRFKKVSINLDENQKMAIGSSINRFKKFLAKHDIETKDFSEVKYNSGLTGIDIVTIEKDPTSNEEKIKEVLEPAVLVKGKIVKNAKAVIVCKGD